MVSLPLCVRVYTGEAPCSPVASIFSTFPDISPKKVSALHNVFVSPLRSSKVCKHCLNCIFHKSLFVLWTKDVNQVLLVMKDMIWRISLCLQVDMLMSPRTRSLYACVGESTKEYQSPSKDLTAINNRLNKRFVANGKDFTSSHKGWPRFSCQFLNVWGIFRSWTLSYFSQTLGRGSSWLPCWSAQSDCSREFYFTERVLMSWQAIWPVGLWRRTRSDWFAVIKYAPPLQHCIKCFFQTIREFWMCC